MASTIRCISQHAEEIIRGSGESASAVMVPVGVTVDDVDLDNPINQRLLTEGLITEVNDKKPRSGRGGDA